MYGPFHMKLKTANCEKGMYPSALMYEIPHYCTLRNDSLRAELLGTHTWHIDRAGRLRLMSLLQPHVWHDSY